MNRSELQTEVIKKVMSDEKFRAEVMKDPKVAISKAFNMTIPESLNVKVVEEDPDTIAIVVPKITNELSDSELDSIAGGHCTFNCFCKFDLF
jgi:hypothetical protein